MHTVTFYSYKGGVGRTLVVANVAKYVARLGMKVFVLDFDLEAPGLHYKFEGEGGKALSVERGLVDIISTFTTTRRLPERLTDYVIDVASPAFATGKIHLLPAGGAPSAGYWKSLSKVDWHSLFYAEKAEGIPLFLELKAFIEETYAPDFVLIDARTGITEMGGVATTVLSDQVVCMMLPTREHLEGTRGVMHAVRAAPRLEGAGEIGLLAVLSRMPHKSDGDENTEVERVKALLNAPIDEMGTSLRIDDIPVLHREPALEEREQILVGSGRSLDESLLLRDYVRLFLKLIPPGEIEKHVGRLIGDINNRIMQEPDEAEQALEALAKDCLHPEAYRALLRMYRARRSSLSKRLSAAHIFWKIADHAIESLLWDAIKDYDRREIERDPPSFDHVTTMEAIWRLHGPADARFALELANEYMIAKLPLRAIGVLQVNANTGGASVGAVAKLIDLLSREQDLEAADEIVNKYKEQMAKAPHFLRAWAEMVLKNESDQLVKAILADPYFDLTVLGTRFSALAARLRLYQTSDRAAAKMFFDAVKLSGHDGYKRNTENLMHLGALARELSEWDAFKSKLTNTYSDASTLIQEIEKMPVLSGDWDIPF